MRPLVLLFSIFWSILVHADILEDTDAFIKRKEIPGIGLTVIKQGEVVFFSGFGVCKRGEKQKVDQNTLFQIASLSKAFTSEVVCLLVKDGVLDWNTPIQEYLPDLKLFDKKAEKNVTLKDLLSHQSGFPSVCKNEFRVYFKRNIPEETYFKNLEFLEPEVPFRKTLTYSNQNYFLVDQVIKKVTGKSVSTQIKERILIPLGMQSTILSKKDLKKASNKAYPHFFLKLGIQPEGYDDTDAIIAAFGVISTPEDMSKWLQYLLNKNHKKEEVFRPQVAFNKKTFGEDLEPLLHKFLFREDSSPKYALGWMVINSNYHTIYLHTGVCSGFLSYLVLIPDLKSGFYFSVNTQDESAIVIFNELLDFLLDVRSESWEKRFVEEGQLYNKKMKEKKESILLSYQNTSSMSFGSKDLEGDYFHKTYGKVQVVSLNGKMEIILPSQEKGQLVHLGDHHFLLKGIFSQNEEDPWIVTFHPEEKALEIKDYAFFKQEKS